VVEEHIKCILYNVKYVLYKKVAVDFEEKTAYGLLKPILKIL